MVRELDEPPPPPPIAIPPPATSAPNPSHCQGVLNQPASSVEVAATSSPAESPSTLAPAVAGTASTDAKSEVASKLGVDGELDASSSEASSSFNSPCFFLLATAAFSLLDKIFLDMVNSFFLAILCDNG